MAVRVSPIMDPDVRPVAEFLHRELNARVPPEAWERAIRVPWKVDAPSHGFLLRDGDAVVGAYLAFYSERPVAGRLERFCNLGAWCVRPEFRMSSLRLLTALLAQDGYHFTDLSPSGSVIPLNSRLRFQFLDTAAALVPALPWPSWPGRTVVSADPAVIEAALAGRDLEIYRDHADAGAAHHVLVSAGGEHCHVIFRRDRRKGLPLFASVLYASNPALLRRRVRPFARHLLTHHGVLAVLAEDRVLGGPTRAGLRLRANRRKMFRSPSLRPDQIDYLYSELVCVAW